MSKIRVQLLDEKDVVCDQFIVDLNGEDAEEEIDEDLIDGYNWFRGLKIIADTWFPYCNDKESWALEIKKDLEISEKTDRWIGDINNVCYSYLRNSDGSYALDKEKANKRL